MLVRCQFMDTVINGPNPAALVSSVLEQCRLRALFKDTTCQCSRV